jgi:hypothetical protein
MKITFKTEHAAACSVLKVVFVVDESETGTAARIQTESRSNIFLLFSTWCDCPGWSMESFMSLVGAFPYSPDGKYMVFEGNHRLAVLFLLLARIQKEFPGDIEAQIAAWADLAIVCNEAGVPMVQCTLWSADLPTYLMITLAQS